MKCGDVNMPVFTPAVRSNLSRCTTVDPFPFVPPTVMTRYVGLATPNVRATEVTRARPISIVLGCTDSCRVSHSARVRKADICLSGSVRGDSRRSRRLLFQQQTQHRPAPVAHVTAVDDHVQGTVLE